MTSNDKELDQWTDKDAYYWVFEIGIAEEHAVAIWNGAVNGKQLIAMTKSRLLEICKNLDRDTTSHLWREVKKLQKQSRKSIFKRGKPTPIMPDYPGDDSFDSDSDFDSGEEEGDNNTEDMNNHSSLPDLLKERLKEFKAQQEVNSEQDMYIAPDTEEPQDEYEEFTLEDEDSQEVYITPQNDAVDAPPAVPQRVPMSMNATHMSAPVLPPRPGGHSPSRTFPRPNPTPQPESEDEIIIAPPEEEYIVPDSHGIMIPESQEDLYLPPNDDEDDDCGDTYVAPNEVPAGVSKSQLLPRQPFSALPKPPPMPGANKLKKTFNKPPDIIMKQPPLPSSKNDKPSISSRMKQFESPKSVPQPPKPAAPQGGNLWPIIKQTTQPRPASSNLSVQTRKNTPGFNPPSPKRMTSPRSAPPLPSPSPTMPRSAPSLPSPLSPRPSPTPQMPTIPRQTPAPPQSLRPVQPSRTHTPDLPRPSFPNSSRTRADGNNMSDCDWFHATLSREAATSALQRYREDSAFVVRPSSKNPDFPYTLQLFYKGKIRNLQIGLRQDKKFALGALKEGETRFASVRELIDYHRTHDVVLANNEGRTCLIKPVPIP